MSPTTIGGDRDIGLLRPAVRELPKYNAGLPAEAVRSRYKVERIAKLASNENPFGASPRAIEALANQGGLLATYPDGNCNALRDAFPNSRRVIGADHYRQWLRESH